MIAAHLSIQHPEYNRPSLANDLMLIKLEELVPQSDTISTSASPHSARPLGILASFPAGVG